MAGLSGRGRRLVAGVVPAYMEAHTRLRSRAWTPENPDGYLALSVAENTLMWDLLEPKLSPPVPASATRYDDFGGSRRLRGVLADLLGPILLGRPMDPETVVLMAGAGAVLEALFYTLLDPGDAVLVPTPSYAGFWMDIGSRDEGTLVGVDTSTGDGFELDVSMLDRALSAADRPVRAVLLTNPDNPTGRVYGRRRLEEIVEWCGRRDLHLVTDEVYAMSVFGAESFTGVGSLEATLGERIHVIWAISKDFAMSGLRCGALITENESVRASVTMQGMWAGVSGHTQHVLAEMLGDPAWVERYLAEMPRRLGASYRRVTEALAASRIRWVPSDAGFFLLLDLREHLSAPTFEAEHELWQRIIAAGVNLTPGQACRIAEPGFFRLCFAAIAPRALDVAVGRVAAVLSAGSRSTGR